MDKRGVATGQEQEEENRERDPGGVRLERRGPGELALAVDALLLAAVEEAEVAGADGHPVDKCGDGDDFLQPGEHVVGAGGQGHVRQTHEEAEEGHADPRNAEAVDSLKERRRVAVACHAI